MFKIVEAQLCTGSRFNIFNALGSIVPSFSCEILHALVHLLRSHPEVTGVTEAVQNALRIPDLHRSTTFCKIPDSTPFCKFCN